jgi:hypothetical protein
MTDWTTAAIRLAFTRVAELDACLGTTRIIRWAHENQLDLAHMHARGLAPCLVPVAPSAAGLFELAAPDERDARLAVVFEVMADDDETPVDLVALAATAPDRFRVFTGEAAVLGAWNAAAHIKCSQTAPLRIWRTPWSWLRHGCDGVAVLRREEAFEALRDVPSSFRAEDQAHAVELGRTFASWIEPSRLVFGRPAMRVAA